VKTYGVSHPMNVEPLNRPWGEFDSLPHGSSNYRRISKPCLDVSAALVTLANYYCFIAQIANVFRY
jgi:hypothetical protein